MTLFGIQPDGLTELEQVALAMLIGQTGLIRVDKDTRDEIIAEAYATAGMFLDLSPDREDEEDLEDADV